MRIALVTSGTLGDVLPFVALGVRLRTLGHDVRLLTHDLFVPLAAEHGVEAVPIGAPTRWEDIRETGRRVFLAGPRRQIEILQDFHLRAPERQYRDACDVLADCRLAVCHAIHHLGQAAAVRCGVPWIAVRLDPALVPTRTAPPAPFPRLVPLLHGWLWRWVERFFRPADERLRRILATLGAEVDDPRMFRAVSPRLNLVACSPRLWPPPADLPPRFVVTGPFRLPARPWHPEPELARFLAAPSAPAVVTLGSMTTAAPETTTRRLLRALARTGTRAIVQTGAGLVPVASEADVRFEGSLPHEHLLPRATFVVHHGGAGTTHAACTAGVPSLVLPHVGDQYFWARRLEDLGVAPPALSARRLREDDLAARIDALGRTPDYAARASSLARDLRAEDGAGRAAELVERLLAPSGGEGEDAGLP